MLKRFLASVAIGAVTIGLPAGHVSAEDAKAAIAAASKAMGVDALKTVQSPP